MNNSNSKSKPGPTSTSAAETRDLRRVRDSVPWRVQIVAIIILWERAAFWGTTAPWQNYMEHPPRQLDQPTPGALNLGQSVATRIYCAFYIFCYTTPILFAVLADSRLGRYRTLVISGIFYCVGCTVLTISSMPKMLDKGWGLPGLLLAMLFIGLGGGGFRAITVPFITDQYKGVKHQLRILKTGEQVMIDHQLTVQYIYSLYYWVGNVGSLSWFATVYIEMHYGFAGAYGLTLGFLVLAMLMLITGRHWYIRVPCEGNILPNVARILTCACRNGFKMAYADPEYQIVHRHKVVMWSNVSQLVDEVAYALRACRVLVAFVMFYVCFDQMQNNLISQAGRMKTDDNPNDLLPAMNQISCIFLGPIIQNIIYPCLHRRGLYPPPIMRITIGFIFITLSMLYATILQLRIYHASPCYREPEDCSFSKVNMWIQAPLYFFISAGEIFAYATGLEYAYTHSPKDAKVIVQAISLLIGAVGSAGAMSLTPIAHDPNMVVFYASLTGGMATTTIVFWLVFKKYDKQQCFEDNHANSNNSALERDNEPLATRVTKFPLFRKLDIDAIGSEPSTNQLSIQLPELPRKSSRRARIIHSYIN